MRIYNVKHLKFPNDALVTFLYHIVVNLGGEVTILKKFFVFIISFGTLFTAFQIVSGLILTAFYTPNFTSVTNELSQEASFGSASNTLPLALLTAIVTYFLSQKKFRISKIKTN